MDSAKIKKKKKQTNKQEKSEACDRGLQIAFFILLS